MGGGLFNTPLYLNPKCLVFSAFVLFVYWSPQPKTVYWGVFVSFWLAFAAYILMAWYDYLYDCTDRFGPTFLGYLSMAFKPAEYREKYNALPVKYQKMVRDVDLFILGASILMLLVPFIIRK
jgi:hypothetical protein